MYNQPLKNLIKTKCRLVPYFPQDKKYTKRELKNYGYKGGMCEKITFEDFDTGELVSVIIVSTSNSFDYTIV